MGKMLNQEKLKILALERDFKLIKQDHRDILAERELLHRTTNEVTIKARSETPNRPKLMGHVVTNVELKFLDLAMQLIWEFLMWCR